MQHKIWRPQKCATYNSLFFISIHPLLLYWIILLTPSTLIPDVISKPNPPRASLSHSAVSAVGCAACRGGVMHASAKSIGHFSRNHANFPSLIPTLHWTLAVSFSFGVGWIPFSHYLPSGVIRIGLPVWEWKSWKNMETKVAWWAENGTVWMPLALETLILIQFLSWMNSLFP